MKNKQEPYDKLMQMSRNDDHTTGNLLNFLYHQNYYNLVCMDLLRKINKNIHHQINFTEKLGKNDGTTMFFIAEKQQKTILSFFLIY